MDIRTPHPKAESSQLPEGIYILPRKPEGLDFGAVPRDWFAGSRPLSSALNLFSLIIPEHERFFIRTVRKYKAGAESEETQALVRAFMQQEAIHYQVHEAFNETRRAHGMQLDRDLETIRKAFDAIERRYSLKVRLGMTAFMEHVTAVSAHIALGKHSPLSYMHPTMSALWEWHALEEIEHKAVAYDLFERAGGGYFLRVYSAVLTVLADARLFRVLARRARADYARARAEGAVQATQLTDEQRATRKHVHRLERMNLVRSIGAALRYFVPGFHPWQIDDSELVRRAYPKYDRALPERAA
jgi:predicted metal-dependent hydrolase